MMSSTVPGTAPLTGAFLDCNKERAHNELITECQRVSESSKKGYIADGAYILERPHNRCLVKKMSAFWDSLEAKGMHFDKQVPQAHFLHLWPKMAAAASEFGRDRQFFIEDKQRRERKRIREIVIGSGEDEALAISQDGSVHVSQKSRRCDFGPHPMFESLYESRKATYEILLDADRSTTISTNVTGQDSTSVQSTVGYEDQVFP